MWFAVANACSLPAPPRSRAARELQGVEVAPELHALSSASKSDNVAAEASIVVRRRICASVGTLSGLLFRPKREVTIGPTFCLISPAEATQAVTWNRESR